MVLPAAKQIHCVILRRLGCRLTIPGRILEVLQPSGKSWRTGIAANGSRHSKNPIVRFRYLTYIQSGSLRGRQMGSLSASHGPREVWVTTIFTHTYPDVLTLHHFGVRFHNLPLHFHDLGMYFHNFGVRFHYLPLHFHDFGVGVSLHTAHIPTQGNGRPRPHGTRSNTCLRSMSDFKSCAFIRGDP